MAVSAKIITEIVSKLECGKSAGPDGISAECFKFSNTKIHVLLSLLFSMCLSHGYFPSTLIKTTIIPIVVVVCPQCEREWVDSNFQIIDLLVPPRAAGVAGTLIFVHIANFATLQPWLHVGSFTCILNHCIRTRDPYFYVPLRDTELCD